MNKRGQFYLIATILIISTMIALIGISNYYKKNDYPRIYEIKEELEIESSNVLDYGGINELRTFLTDYSSYIGEDIVIYAIMGEIGSSDAYEYSKGIESSYSHDEEGGTATIIVDENEYSFDLKAGENFYFIILQTEGDEKYVVTN